MWSVILSSEVRIKGMLQKKTENRIKDQKGIGVAETCSGMLNSQASLFTHHPCDVCSNYFSIFAFAHWIL